MSILKEQAIIGNYIVHKKQGEIKRGLICENLRTKWTGFICKQTGFIRRRTGFIRRTDEASPKEASPIGPYIYFFFFSFLKCFLFCLQREFYHQNQRYKPLFLRTYVDLLNYPFKQHCWLFAGPPFTLTIYMNIQRTILCLYIYKTCASQVFFIQAHVLFLYKLHVETILFCGLCLRPKQMAKPQNHPASFDCHALSVTPAVHHTAVLPYPSGNFSQAHA